MYNMYLSIPANLSFVESHNGADCNPDLITFFNFYILIKKIIINK